jgi:hypothetical protein
MTDRMKEILNITSKVKNKKADLTTRNLLGKMRELHEQDDIGNGENRKTIYDQSREEKKFRNNFDDLNVVIEFIPLEIYDNYVFWGGTIDGTIQFAYKVTPDEETSGVEFNYLEGFDPGNPDNEEIIDRIENYYDQFYKYWRDNIFQT